MIPARASVHLQGGDGESDLRPGDVALVEADHPWIAGGYLVPLEQALADRKRDDLVETAKALGVTGTSNMNRDELVSAIEEAAVDQQHAEA